MQKKCLGENNSNNLSPQGRKQPEKSGIFCLSKTPCGLFILIILLLFTQAKATELNYTDNQILWAIFYAEGGFKAQYLFGIRSVPYKDFREAKQICLNTIRNQRIRHSKHNCNKDFLTCLWHKYCPPQAHKLNQYWLKNVLYYLKKGTRGRL